MAQTSDYAPGMPTWAELSTPDLEASKRFYSALFGWSYLTVAAESLGDYEMCTLGGTQGPQIASMQAMADDTLPPSWTCFFRTADVAATVSAVRSAGGRALTDPVQVAQMGRLAMFADPEGASFAVWQPYEYKGAEATGEPATMCWVELACRDIEQARSFYRAVFNWRAVDHRHNVPAYTVFKLVDEAVAGMIRIEDSWPAHQTPHWIPYFAVADCDASAALAADFGARIHVSPSDIPPGRIAAMTDPVGARLVIITLAGHHE
ncbi:hypothetical protein F8568_038050 [Actinomadura sp. LD22]|uniref:VOC domain-containing protein n=1 Tax=Actinomadura physcomitrii TaxID=2650748 RepID=A0A6I4MUS2_9ACTN|nr:VOC family protein [Actinomadura physcomitrii]MWA06056.1 hypothetical protein [Actinomadura physcomitrii]